MPRLLAFTVKSLGKKKESSYHPFFLNMFLHIDKINYLCAEYDSKGKLHYHGSFEVSNTLFLKKFCVKGFHFKLVPIYDERKWKKYCFKSIKDFEKSEPDLLCYERLTEQDINDIVLHYADLPVCKSRCLENYHLKDVRTELSAYLVPSVNANYP